MKLWALTNAAVIVAIPLTTVAGVDPELAAITLIYWLIPSLLWMIWATDA